MVTRKRKTLEGILYLYSETGTEGGHWAFQDKRFITLTPPSFGVFANQTVWDSNNPERRGKIQNKNEVFLNGKWLPLPDPMTEDPDYVISSLFHGERRGNHEADKRLMERYGFKIEYAADRMNKRFGKGNWHLEDPSTADTAVTSDGTRWCYGGTPSTKPERPYGVPQNGLTRTTVKWDDDIVEQERLSNTLLVTNWSYEGLHLLKNGDGLTIYHPQKKDQEVWTGIISLHQHKAFTQAASGMWIHADQKGIEREIWAEYFFKGYPARLVPYRKRKS